MTQVNQLYECGTDGSPLFQKSEFTDFFKKSKDLTNINFCNYDFTNDEITGATVKNTDFSNSTLSNITTGDVTGSPFLPEGWILQGGYFLGDDANLNEANLGRTNLLRYELKNAGIDERFVDIEQLLDLKKNETDIDTYLGELTSFEDDEKSLTDDEKQSLRKILLSKYDSIPNISNENDSIPNISNETSSNPSESGEDINSGALNLQGANLNSADFSGTTLKNIILPTNINSTIFENSKLVDIDFKGIDLSKTDRWDNAKFVNAGFKNAILDFFDFGKTVIKDTDFSDVDLTSVKGFTNTKLDSVKFTDAILHSGEGSEQVAANFSDSTFKNIDLEGIDLSKANLKGLSSSGLYNVDQSNLPADWLEVNGTLFGPSAYVKNVEIDDTKFTPKTLQGIRSKGIEYVGTSPSPNFDEGWGIRSGIIVGPTADLTSRIFHDQDFTEIDLINATLDNINTKDITININDLPDGWHLVNNQDSDDELQTGILIGPNVNLDESNLEGLDLRAIRLDGAISFGNIESNSETRLPQRWHLYNGYLLGEKARIKALDERPDLSGINNNSLPRLNTGLNMNNADLRSANLSFSIIKGRPGRHNFDDSKMNDAMLDNVTFENVSMKKTRLKKASLKNANFTGVKLKNAKLNDAVLTDSVFTDVVLEGADLTGADLTGSTWKNVTLINSTIDGTIFTNTEFELVDFSGAKADDIEPIVEGSLNWRRNIDPCGSIQSQGSFDLFNVVC